MKRIVCLILSLVLIVAALCGCDPGSQGAEDGRLKIVASIFPQYDFARQLAGDLCQVSMLVTPGAETHGFEPTTSDVMKLSECDIFIYTGGESDAWLDSLLSDINNPDLTVVSLMDCVEPIEVESGEAEGHSHGSEVDEHIWTSPLNAIKICEKITEALKEKDGENFAAYQSNFEELKAQLTSLDSTFRDIVENAERRTVVFGDRFPLIYFAKEYSLEYYSAFSGCSDDTEASASTVAALIDKVKEKNIPVVYKIELSSDAVAKTICEETEAQLMTFYSCHNISKEDFDKGETYVSLMHKNAESLKTALN